MRTQRQPGQKHDSYFGDGLQVSLLDRAANLATALIVAVTLQINKKKF